MSCNYSQVSHNSIWQYCNDTAAFSCVMMFEKLLQVSFPFMSFLDHQHGENTSTMGLMLREKRSGRWSQSAVINFCIPNIVSLPPFLLDTLSLPRYSLIILAPPLPGPIAFHWLTSEDMVFSSVSLSYPNFLQCSSLFSPEEGGTIFKISVNLNQTTQCNTPKYCNINILYSLLLLTSQQMNCMK